MRVCEFPGCGKPYASNGLCEGHRSQRSKGHELKPLRYKQPRWTPVIHFIEVPCLVDGLVGNCHEWLRGKNQEGYDGRIKINGRLVVVHLYIWELANGEIEGDLLLDHKCRNRACCNVNHLRLVTHRVNSIENSFGVSAINAKKTHCKHGHPFDEENTIKRSDGGRRCVACERERYKKRRK